MSTTDTERTQQAERTLQVYRVYIKVTPEKVWQAITDPEWNGRYGYGAPQFFELRPGGSYRSTASEEMRKVSDEMGYGIPDVVVDGEVLEAHPPRKLVQTFRMLMSPDAAADGFTQLTYEISEVAPGVSRLTVTHDVTGAPSLAAVVAGAYEDQGGGGGGGWAWILSDLKSLLETGSVLAA
ncbi:MAG TPA: SRPBCC domain-containing protein [Blastococcus sp.]|nr:SRPBCC domain-containing protein [Blastococcus sp.]